MKHEFIGVIDFSGGLDQLLPRRIRELGVYCEVFPHTVSLEELCEKKPIGIILTGEAGDSSDPNAPEITGDIFSLGVPILATEFAARWLAKKLGGTSQNFTKISAKEPAVFETDTPLFYGMKKESPVWINTTESLSGFPDSIKTIATSSNTIVAFGDVEKHIYGITYRPEVSDTEEGLPVLRNFLVEICGVAQDWSMANYGENAISHIRKKVGKGKVLLALSGGVDSSVVASLLEKAVGNQLYCIFVDHGLMRLNEGDQVEAAFKDSGMNFIRVNAEKRFLDKLAGVSDPETKRKIIGEEFIRVFEEEAKKIGTVDFFAQGTIYPDVIESEMADGTVIKSHHNVGGLPDHVDFKEIIEPLRMLFKDEVRLLGEELGIPSYLVWRQPFPGPGLAIRVIGDITKDKLEILRKADHIYREEIANAGLDRDINQYFVVLTNMRSVGVSEDKRTYDYTMALRAVTTNDFMTAQWSRIPFDLLDRISRRIVAEVDHVNRIVYDITSKPPSTIEWE